MKNTFYILFSLLLKMGCSSSKHETGLQDEVQTYLDAYNIKFQQLLIETNEAQWTLNTMIRDNDSTTTKKATEAGEAFAKFTGSKENIEKVKTYLASKEELTPIQVKQLEAILFMAGGNPEIAGDVVKDRIKAEADQTGLLYGYKYMLNGKEVSTNDLDDILKNSKVLNDRLAAWNTSKEVGKTLKTGLENLINLRNKSVQALDYPDYFAYQAAEYGMKSDEVMGCQCNRSWSCHHNAGAVQVCQTCMRYHSCTSNRPYTTQGDDATTAFHSSIVYSCFRPQSE